MIMKSMILMIIILAFPGFKAEKIDSKVYPFPKLKAGKTKSVEQQTVMNGETTHMENFEITAATLEPGRYQRTKIQNDAEEIVVVKEGRLKVALNNKTKELGQGSVVLILPGDELKMENADNDAVTYYAIQYKSKKPIDSERGKTAGGSMTIDWNDLKFTPHDKGGVRRYFDRKSAMSDRIEMHVTTLNPNIKSHEPHTHNPAEIIIMMDGNTEMEIGNKHFRGEPGDIYFLGSEIPHAIRNTGNNPCMYMAFQWE